MGDRLKPPCSCVPGARRSRSCRPASSTASRETRAAMLTFEGPGCARVRQPRRIRGLQLYPVDELGHLLIRQAKRRACLVYRQPFCAHRVFLVRCVGSSRTFAHSSVSASVTFHAPSGCRAAVNQFPYPPFESMTWRQWLPQSQPRRWTPRGRATGPWPRARRRIAPVSPARTSSLLP